MSRADGRQSRGIQGFFSKEDFMRFPMLALAGVFALATTAAYADDPMANTYNNTVTTKNTKTGAVGTLLFNADGTYTANGMGPDGKAATYPGKWTTKDGGATLCLQPGIPNAPQSCSPVSSHPVGEHWTVTNSTGDSFDVVVTAGR
jgi:hypothetical protein